MPASNSLKKEEEFMMNEEKIAILTDSGCDVPVEFVSGRDDIFVVPLRVSFKDAEYKDDGSLSREKIQEMLDVGGVKTSLPTGEDVIRAIEEIKERGFKRVFVITISSGLSGTFNFIKLICEDFKELEFCFLDTKNIGMGSGFSVLYAAGEIDAKASFEDVVSSTTKVCSSTAVYFCLMTLEYLRRGGRIGLVEGALGSLFNIKPVISCNRDGIYCTVAKKMGYNSAIEEVIALVKERVQTHAKYNLVVAYGELTETVSVLCSRLKQIFPQCKKILRSGISSALTVHTGLSLIGVGVQVIE